MSEPISTTFDQLADMHEERNPGGFSGYSDLVVESGTFG